MLGYRSDSCEQKRLHRDAMKQEMVSYNDVGFKVFRPLCHTTYMYYVQATICISGK